MRKFCRRRRQSKHFSDGRTALHHASGGHAEVVQLLLEAGAVTAMSGRNDVLELHRATQQAVFYGHADCVDLLLEARVDIGYA